MGAPSRPRCPICGRAASVGPENPARPFCSAQCKLLDLDRWLTEGYRVPGPPVESSEDGEARSAPDLDGLDDLKGDEES